MSEVSYKTALITAIGAIIAALISAFAVIYVYEAEKPGVSKPGTSTTGIYLHIRNESQMAFADSVKSRLEARGYYVPGVRTAGESKRTEVRYFYQNEEKGADYIVRLLRDWGVKNVEKVRVRHLKPDSHHYEVYFGQMASNASSP
jgi:hypothetical protein